ncbi:MAG: type I 3-dehydroquinate dehydratase [Ignavibacteriae bacterium]|nr:type I 3-dehydroquinate dehydratase [Ignavibacteria bacterium]MBI3364498.1 type I 3-dehydroquinate dehydratase [Ignavibacteriota bacterium]
MRVCISIAPSSTKDAVAKLKQAARQTDLVELRIDGANDLDIERLLRRPRPEVIVTNRRRSEGGRFDGNGKDQLEILTTALRLGAEYVDVEASWGTPVVRQLVKNKGRGRVIVSYHNFENTPRNIHSIYTKLSKHGADIIKIATTASDINDNRLLFDILQRSRAEKQKTAAFCMAERGQISRILGGIFGCHLMYAAFTSTECTAPGQLTAADLKKIYQVHTLDRRTRIFGLVGNPVSHSRGIHYHNAFFHRRSINAVYVNFLVDDVRKFFTAFRATLSGASVTMPFKQDVIPLLDRLEDDARRISSVNTIIMRRGKAIGYNTDLPAIISVIRKRTSLRGKRALVLGTGATAKTMLYAMAANGAHVTVAGRSPRKAKALASEFNCEWALLNDLSSLTTDIVMNATPVGMSSIPDGEIVPRKILRKGTIVFDAVYSPPTTPLLRSARLAGCTTISGMELFEEQANFQSRLFQESIR